LPGGYELEIYRFAETVREMAANGGVPDMRGIEEGFRRAALADANIAFTQLLNEIPETEPVCPCCGKTMRNLGKRSKKLVSLLGDGEISRNYYECGECHEHSTPKDVILGIERTMFTPGVRRAAAKLGSCDSFESSSVTMEELCGIVVSSKDIERISEAIGGEIEKENKKDMETILSGNADGTPAKPIPVMYIEFDGTGIPMIKKELNGRRGKQEDGTSKSREAKIGCIFTQTAADDEGHPVRDSDSTTYFGAIETAEDFGRRLYGEAVQRGVQGAEQVVVIGDGAKWIWNLADLNFPGAIEIVDLFHAKEHVWELIKQLEPDEKARLCCKKEWYALLEQGDITELTKKFADFHTTGSEQQKQIDREIGYFSDNAERMQYEKFKGMGLFVGSGVIEAACKNVIGKRLKQSGMHWSLNGANNIIALRCAVLSGCFDNFFAHSLAA
jgi:hypothetical protein